jgi:hypothetical protein
VGVFLRWGALGIISIAALMYAYNATKRLADGRAASSTPAVAQADMEEPEVEQEPEPTADAAPEEPAQPAPGAPPHCEAELRVAQRAIELKKEGAPLDRVLRMQEIAFQQSAERRQRLEKVAARWFGYEGEFQPEALRIAVVSDCVQTAPAP